MSCWWNTGPSMGQSGEKEQSYKHAAKWSWPTRKCKEMWKDSFLALSLKKNKTSKWTRKYRLKSKTPNYNTARQKDKKMSAQFWPSWWILDMVLWHKPQNQWWDSLKLKFQEWVIWLIGPSSLSHKSGFGLQTHVKVERENWLHKVVSTCVLSYMNCAPSHTN